MSDFFREVDEEVRRDKAAIFLQKYWIWILGLALLIIAATITWRIELHRRSETAEAAGSRYEAALQLARDGKSAEAQEAFQALAKDSPPGIGALARMRAAGELAKSDPAAAAKAYEALADDPSFDASLAPLARLRAALLQIDREDPKAFEAKASAMAGPAGVFRASARELLALAALKGGDYDAAGRWLDQIVADPQAPSGARSRAEAFLSFVRSGKPSQ